MNQTKLALVTGASRGLAAANWTVALNYSRDVDGAEGIVREIAAYGGKAAPFRFDILDTEALRTGMAVIRNCHGTPHLIVNNATGPQPELPIEEQAWEHCLDQCAFMVKAPFELLQFVLPECGTAAWLISVRRSPRSAIRIFGHYVAAKGAMLSRRATGPTNLPATMSQSTSSRPAGFRSNAIARSPRSGGPATSPAFPPPVRHSGGDRRGRPVPRFG